MPHHFRAVALDYDGTLTTTGRPDETILEALRCLRQEGIRLVLVTGRIPWELLDLFPQVEETFDRIVWENGAVVWSPRGQRLLAPPVSSELEEALAARGARLRRGQVILAGLADDAPAALDEVGRLGLEVQLVRNRHELMLVPSGISKGTGLFEALGDLGVSRHSTLAVGDAENDHSLLASAELGVAVENAVPALKALADVVLEEPGSTGLARFLGGPALERGALAEPRRWRATLGTYDDGTAATVPASGSNLLVVGGSASGKSHLAGLFVERVLEMGYSVCVLDPEGDHVALGKLRGVLAVGGDAPLLPPEQLPRLLEHRFGSVTVDLSLLDDEEKHGYGRTALGELGDLYADGGLPHWLVLDEAQRFLSPLEPIPEGFEADRKGLCLVTWLPSEIDGRVLAGVDYVLSFPGVPEPLPDALRWAGSAADLGPGEALLSRRDDGAGPRRLKVGLRSSPHARHLHKYVRAQLPSHLRFEFRAGDEPTGRSAGNVDEFHRELRRSDGRVVRHHALRGDFSRWIAEVLHDDGLAQSVRRLERALRHRASAGEVEALRAAILAAVQDRYRG